ncbi:MAG TPA: ShlB/FhaC/HecB family hemolysin secretion/activation protein [Sphingomicrobium sp.]
MRNICGFLLLAALPAGALAQTSTPIDQNRVDRTPAPSVEVPKAPISSPAAATKVDAGDETAPPIRNILFEGSDVPQIVAQAAERFIGQAATRANLQALAAAMSDAYGRSPVALFTIAIPDQDLSAGDVRVLVAEGHVEAVVLSGEVEGRELKRVRRYADRLTRERPTSRRTLERYLSLIQDIPGLKVQSELQMGEGPGGVRLILKLDYQRPTLSFAFDNRTTRLVDDGQFHATARGYQLLREGDETQINGTASVDFNDLLFVGLSHSTPIGHEGTRLALNAGFLRTRPDGSDRSGEARSAGITLSHPLIRSYRRNLTVSLALDGLNSENAAFGSLISTERSRAIRLAGAYAQASPRRIVSAGLTASKGIRIFDADVPAAIGDATFFKVNGRGTLDQAIGKQAAVRLRANGQWTKDPLPAVERFAVGGASVGRAFEVGLINADRGLGGLAELAWRPIRSGKLATSELYGFADYAAVRLLRRPGFDGRNFDLASAGVGGRLGWTDKAMIEVEFAHVLDDPFVGYDEDWRLSLSWRLNLRP